MAFSYLSIQVITNEEAERRGKIYDTAGRTFLFDLDYNDTEPQFTVDAGTYGNISHFVNHSVSTRDSFWASSGINKSTSPLASDWYNIVV